MSNKPILPILPVDAIVPRILSHLRESPSLVVEAPPGAGKTTRVPSALLDLVSGEILVLEPRRIAARMAARRVAWELGEELGQTVGYQVRFEELSGPRTRLRFVTEGILTRRFISDPELCGVDAVVLDEFHERHLDGDLALALLKRLQQRRPELRIVVMSATLDAAPIARFLDDCPILRAEGRLYDLTIEYLPYSSDVLHLQVKRAVERLLSTQHEGNILAFLPGTAEIRRTMRELDSLSRQAGLVVLPLYGDLSPAEQDRAVARSSEQKLILATNVAESSVTVEGVTAVIDSGLARIATYSLWTGLPTLQLGRISRASATQRAGRAGRTSSGRVLRLYPEEDYLRRPAHEMPEIVRTDLSQLCLTLRVMHLDGLDWLDVPPREAMENAQTLLDRLGAIDGMEHKLARFPLPPRLSRILSESIERGVGEDGCRAVALLASGTRNETNDLLVAMDVLPDGRTQQLTQQLRRIARPAKQIHHDDKALLLSVLAGFPDRVARRRLGNQVLLASGVSAEVAGESPHYEYMIALDAEDRTERALPLIRLMAKIEPEWLIELFPNRVEEREEVRWNRATERVERVSELLYDKLVLQESRGPASEQEAADLLAQIVIEDGIERFVDKDLLESFLARTSFARLVAPDLIEALREFCTGLQSLAEVRSAGKHFVSLLEGRINAQALNERAPLSVRLKSGRQIKVHYEQGRQPWIASRLQDFFGMEDTPRIGPEQTPLTIHLLAPNQRAVQTTTDLAGFWQRLYPQVRRELMRRYPHHSWPERP